MCSASVNKSRKVKVRISVERAFERLRKFYKNRIITISQINLFDNFFYFYVVCALVNLNKSVVK